MADAPSDDDDDDPLIDLLRDIPAPSSDGATLRQQLGDALRRRQPPREHVTRGPDRRHRERRQLGFKARRADDAELNRQRRAFLLSWLQQQTPETIWLWINGMWIGRASDAELAVLAEAARKSGMPRPTASRRGRPHAQQLLASASPHSNAVARAIWREYTKQLTVFCDARRRHHARRNQTRRGTPRSSAFRDACLASPFGELVDLAGLFAEFFDSTHLSPQQMAACLLHRVEKINLMVNVEHATMHAAETLGPDDRAYWRSRAKDDAARLRRLGSWQTLYRKLRTTDRRKPTATPKTDKDR